MEIRKKKTKTTCALYTSSEIHIFVINMEKVKKEKKGEIRSSQAAPAPLLIPKFQRKREGRKRERESIPCLPLPP